MMFTKNIMLLPFSKQTVAVPILLYHKNSMRGTVVNIIIMLLTQQHMNGCTLLFIVNYIIH